MILDQQVAAAARQNRLELLQWVTLVVFGDGFGYLPHAAVSVSSRLTILQVFGGDAAAAMVKIKFNRAEITDHDVCTMNTARRVETMERDQDLIAGDVETLKEKVDFLAGDGGPPRRQAGNRGRGRTHEARETVAHLRAKIVRLEAPKSDASSRVQ
eukprot:g16290.t1